MLVTYKPIKTRKGDVMVFGTFLDSHYQYFDTTHFPDCWQQYPITGKGFYLLEGKIVQEFGSPSIEVTRLAPLPMKTNPIWEIGKKKIPGSHSGLNGENTQLLLNVNQVDR
ncbi:MAG: hypothetical protein DDT42_02132 [candidate division WS2 bacterium]|uniref:Uncharacterized protein n=1 Tax=Psychracetigena formicireducens TaxID=2986056 RepID=A0A9E2F7C5_PSYF1|nr:hypothetical protein [Candidatus Psychracetigena formicireducens]